MRIKEHQTKTIAFNGFQLKVRSLFMCYWQ